VGLLATALDSFSQLLLFIFFISSALFVCLLFGGWDGGREGEGIVKLEPTVLQLSDVNSIMFGSISTCSIVFLS